VICGDKLSRRAQQAEQRERIPSAKKKMKKPWAACWQWGPQQRHVARRSQPAQLSQHPLF
jgi:hypothetical protein